MQTILIGVQRLFPFVCLSHKKVSTPFKWWFVCRVSTTWKEVRNCCARAKMNRFVFQQYANTPSHKDTHTCSRNHTLYCGIHTRVLAY